MRAKARSATSLVLAALAAHPEDASVQRAGCDALANLCEGDHGAQAAPPAAIPLIWQA